jgi:CPA1 family monovalent cation:H+ antiporter
MMVKRIQKEDNSPETDEYLSKLSEMKLLGLRAEGNYFSKLKESNKIDKEVYEKFEETLDRREEALSNEVRFSLKYFLGKTLRIFYQFRGNAKKEPEKFREKMESLKELQTGAFQAAIESLNNEQKKMGAKYPEAQIIEVVIMGYQGMIRRLNIERNCDKEVFEEQKEELRIIAMDSERQEIQRMYESGDISKEQAKMLRRHINYIESAALDEAQE